MTAHWSDKNYKMHSVVLGCFLHEGESSAEGLVDDFAIKIFKDCGFSTLNISAVVTDTTGNMNKFGLFLEDLEIPHIYCTDHVLQLSAKIAYYDKDMKQEFETMKKVRTLIEHVTRSHLLTEKLLKAQKELNEFENKTPLRLKTDVKTRWWSTHDAIERVVSVKRALNVIVAYGDLEADYLPNENEWRILVGVCKFLKPFKLVMKRLEGEKYSNIGLVPSCISYLRKTIEEAIEENNVSLNQRNDSHTFLEYIIKNISIDFDQRWGDEDSDQFDGEIIRGRANRQVGMHTVIAIACALDPRNKGLSSYNETEKDDIWDILTQYATDYAEENGIYADVINDKDEGMDNNAPQIDNLDNQNMDEFDRFLSDFNQDEVIPANPGERNNDNNDNNDNEADDDEENMCPVLAKCYEEVQKYRRLRSIPYVDNGRILCPLKDFWKHREDKFPVLSRLAKKYLPIPATSAPSERVFSKASRIISKTRNRLSAEIAGTQLFLCSVLDWYEEQIELEN